MKYKYIAKIVIQTTTALHLGSGDYNYEKGSLVQTDWNGLPYLPGTSLAGCARHGLGIEEESTEFGYSKDKSIAGETVGEASKMIFSAGLLLGQGNRAIESIQDIGSVKDSILPRYLELPVRDFVSIDHYSGTAKDKSLHSREMVYKGSRFGFMIEFSAGEEDNKTWSRLLDFFKKDYTRIGSGSRKGFGGFEVIEIESAVLNMQEETQRTQYLNQQFSWNASWSFLQKEELAEAEKTEDWQTWTIDIEPDFNTLIFGAGIGNEVSDATQKKEIEIEWDDQNVPSSEECYLLPGSSIKGAIRHRVIQLDEHKKDDKTLDERIKKIYQNESNPDAALELLEKLAEEFNKGKISDQPSNAARDLFGYLNENESYLGKIIVEDVWLNPKNCYTKVFSHVAIDRFTGAPLNGALFNEEVIIPKKPFSIEVKVNVAKVADDHLGLLKKVLQEIADGLLPIGGMTNKGHGMLSGEFNDHQKITA